MPESKKEEEARRAREEALKHAAKELIQGYEEKYQVDHHVTTGADSGEGAFISETAPDVFAVAIDRGSERGYVEIAGGGVDYFVRTSPERTGIEVITLKNGQRCMLNGRPSVIYIRPRR
ncbi:hypothetical protein N431DRAFT_338417 [Stipitochalara longipes BDJ]|nr:hypothetical protein N431DRAFT_338417 [Stipitochalara longipes BDJ]